MDSPYKMAILIPFHDPGIHQAQKFVMDSEPVGQISSSPTQAFPVHFGQSSFPVTGATPVTPGGHAWESRGLFITVSAAREARRWSVYGLQARRKDAYPLRIEQVDPGSRKSFQQLAAGRKRNQAMT
jgi:hypothetical protein